MSSGDSKIEKMQAQFQTLSSTAASLNAASDELTKVVGILDEALKKLNIGLTVWVTYDTGDANPEEYDDYQIGYVKVDGRWGIGLRHLWGDTNSAEGNVSGPWLFNDAPRELRLQSVDGLPKLVEKLNEEASNAVTRIRKKTGEVRPLAFAVAGFALKSIEDDAVRQGWVSGAETHVTVRGITIEQKRAIIATCQQNQNFVGRVLNQVSIWQLHNEDLRLWFPIEKKPLMESLKGTFVYPTISRAAEEVLGHPVNVIGLAGPMAQVTHVSKEGK